MSSLATESYVENTLLNVVMKITSKNGEPGWVPSNLNEGHLDRFFFPSATLGALNFLLYVFCPKRYKSISLQKREESMGDEITNSAL